MRIDDALALKDNFLINIGESYVVINIDPMMQLQIKIFGAPYKGVIFTY